MGCGRSRSTARHRAGQIWDRLWEVFDLADERGILTAAAADRVAERRMAGRLRGFWLPGHRPAYP